MKLSAKSEEFLANLRMYLMTSGKSEREIDEVADELRDHLQELESRGESIDNITGGSPKRYMQSLEEEMADDRAGWFKYLPAFILSFAAFSAMGPAIRGEFELNVVQLIGFPAVASLTVFLYWLLFRRMAGGSWSNRKLFGMGAGLSVLTIVLFVAVLLVGSLLMEPFYSASSTGNVIVILLSATAFAASAAMLRSWILVFIPMALFLPEWLIRHSAMEEETKLIVSSFVPFLAVAVVIGLVLAFERRKASKA
ncbi:HAAS domain-containing protein [Bhargavaea ullalensis]|uniref:Membrane-anchored protein n=1 Tax=Bhargavaea ullalensis TaxID=1265685 RepID=A0ABV2G7G5_9BACL